MPGYELHQLVDKERSKKIIIIVFITNSLAILTAVLLYFAFCPCTRQLQPSIVVSPERTTNPYWNYYQLPDFISKHIHYELLFQIFTKDFHIDEMSSSTFYGHAKIYFTLSRDSEFIVLNKESINVLKFSIYKNTTSGKMNKLLIKEDIVHDVYNYWIIVLKENLRKDIRYVIDVIYNGNINVNEFGILKTIYNDVRMKKRYFVIYTKLESHGARRMFPCFDQPNLKATFTMSIIHEDHYTALSNMPAIGRNPVSESQLIQSDGQAFDAKLTRFQPTTVPMSSYLIAFVLVENYDFVMAKRNNRSTVRIWFPKRDKGSAEISLTFATKTETFFEEYFNVTSPLPKTDHVYIPNCISSAMENWGLIIYREKSLIAAVRATENEIRRTFDVIAHELAHIWFGNWITTTWWSEIWINEAFAEFFENYAYYKQISLDTVQMEQLYLYERMRVLYLDNFHLARPIIFNITFPSNYRDSFNIYTYVKGDYLLIWLKWIMGASNFRKGLRKYLSVYGQGNPTTEQFFDIMDEFKENNAFCSTLKDYFYPWLHNAGHPILFVDYLHTEELVTITQTSSIASNINQKWPVFTSFTSKNRSKDEPIFLTDFMAIKMKLDTDDFFLLNNNGKAYVRVNYTLALWNKIISLLRSNSSHINPISKVVIHDDSFYFMFNNKFSLSIFKSLIDTLSNETDPVLWLSFYNNLYFLVHRLYRTDPLYAAWMKYIRILSNKTIENALGLRCFDNCNLFEEIHQKLAFRLGCDADIIKVVQNVSRTFIDWIHNPSSVVLPKHLVKEILYYGLRANDKYKHWATLWSFFRNVNVPFEIRHDDLAVGLSGTSKPYLIEMLLNSYLLPRTYKSDTHKLNEFMTLISWITMTDTGTRTLKRWIVKNHQVIKNKAFEGNVVYSNKYRFFDQLVTKIGLVTFDLNDNMAPLVRLCQDQIYIKRIILSNRYWRKTVGKLFLEML